MAKKSGDAPATGKAPAKANTGFSKPLSPPRNSQRSSEAIPCPGPRW